jgi:hypothetical protein
MSLLNAFVWTLLGALAAFMLAIGVLYAVFS